MTSGWSSSSSQYRSLALEPDLWSKTGENDDIAPLGKEKAKNGKLVAMALVNGGLNKGHRTCPSCHVVICSALYFWLDENIIRIKKSVLK